MENKENKRPGALFDDDVVSMTSSEMERQVEEELARMVEKAGDEEAPEPLQLSFKKDEEDYAKYILREEIERLKGIISKLQSSNLEIFNIIEALEESNKDEKL